MDTPALTPKQDDNGNCIRRSMDTEACRKLAIALLREAIRDARAGKTAAYMWLRAEGREWWELIGMDPDILNTFLSLCAKNQFLQKGKSFKKTDTMMDGQLTLQDIVSG
jgi:hypothetical protein